MKNHLPLNLELLKEELSDLKIPVDCPIITFGEPVLRLLLEEKGMSGKEKKVRYYWDCNSTTKSSARYFRFVDESNNALSNKFYPFCHQPSMRMQFYKATFRDYLNFIKGFSE